MKQTWTSEEILKAIKEFRRHGDYDDDYKDGWDAAVESIINHFKKAE